jgi:hypothetical protein
MSYYFDFDLPRGQKGIARIYVYGDGKDRLELAFFKAGRCEVTWSHKPPAGYEVYSLSPASCAEYIRHANKRHHDGAARLAAKAAAR